LGGVIPFRAAATTRVVADFADGDGGVAIFAKVAGKGGILDVFGALEEGSVSSGAVGSGEEGIP
jgi:hypothetical protein